jgi:alpha-L-fucosidase
VPQSFAQQNADVEKLTSGREKRLEWWTDARFGMFIHWGLFSKLAGEYNGKRIDGLGEWIMYNAKIPVDDYRKIANTFNPVDFNADQWVKTAYDAGMKYIVITAKHCDGFAMFNSAANPYNIVDATPFKKDPMKDLEIACKKYGLRFGFYYSQDWDWNEPNAMGRPNTWDFPDNNKKKPDVYYNTKAIPQVKELVTKYDPAIIWFDVPSDITREQSFKFLKTIRDARPDCIINDRISKEHSGGTTGKLVMGDYHTPEQYIPEEVSQPFEVCMTLNDTWGYKYYDRNWKTAKEIIANLIDIASKGGNYLLNIGPDAEGVIPEQTTKVLKLVGVWMDKNGESIYGSAQSPFGKLPFKGARCTAKPGKLFIHLMDWPEGNKLVVPGIRNKIESVYFLKDRSKKIFFRQTAGNDIIIDLGLEKQNKDIVDPFSTTLVVEYSGKLNYTPSDPVVDPAFSAFFDPIDATATGDSLQYGFNKSWKGHRGFDILKWNDTTKMIWNFRTINSGNYEVEINYAADENSLDNEMALKVGNKTFSFKTESTGGWHNFRKVILGEVEINKNTYGTIVLAPQIIHGTKVMNIKSVMLLPIIK